MLPAITGAKRGSKVDHFLSVSGFQGFVIPSFELKPSARLPKRKTVFAQAFSKGELVLKGFVVILSVICDE